MKYGIPFLFIGLALTIEGALLGGLYWLLLWPGTSFIVLGCAYFGLGPRVFGKRADGTIAWHAFVLLLPYLLLTWLIWHVTRLVSREDRCNRVAPGLYVGRRPLSGEVPPDVTLIVDLTAEFGESIAVRTGRQYLAAPMLDTGVIRESDFRRLVDQVAAWPEAVYIHCAQGHGRSGMLAAAVLVAKGHAATIDIALSILQHARPGIGLQKNQRALLAAWETRPR